MAKLISTPYNFEGIPLHYYCPASGRTRARYGKYSSTYNVYIVATHNPDGFKTIISNGECFYFRLLEMDVSAVMNYYSWPEKATAARNREAVRLLIGTSDKRTQQYQKKKAEAEAYTARVMAKILLKEK